MNTPIDNWKTEIVRKLPWSATFLVASFVFFKFTNYELVGWICIVVAIIALFLVIRFEYYEKIIDRQEKQIEKYGNSAIKAHESASKTISEMNTGIAKGLYTKPDEITKNE